MGLKQMGNFDDALMFIEEQLTISQALETMSFFKWLNLNGYTIGHGNIDNRWKEFKKTVPA